MDNLRKRASPGAQIPAGQKLNLTLLPWWHRNRKTGTVLGLVGFFLITHFCLSWSQIDLLCIRCGSRRSVHKTMVFELPVWKMNVSPHRPQEGSVSLRLAEKMGWKGETSHHYIATYFQGGTWFGWICNHLFLSRLPFINIRGEHAHGTYRGHPQGIAYVDEILIAVADIDRPTVEKLVQSPFISFTANQVLAEWVMEGKFSREIWRSFWETNREAILENPIPRWEE